MYGYIYITTNKINGKRYIGQKRSEVFLYNKYLGSGTLLLRAVNKYGVEAFTVEMLCECNSQEELDSKEKFYINRYDAAKSLDFYNIALGSRGGNIHTDDMKEKLRNARLKEPSFTKGKLKINDGVREKLVLPEQLTDYIQRGWKRGRVRSITAGYVYVYKEDKVTAIPKDRLHDYISSGWKRGNLNRGSHGGTIAVRKSGKCKLIDPVDLDKYIQCGWERGKYDVPYIWINNGNQAKTIPETDINKYPDWNRGMLKHSK